RRDAPKARAPPVPQAASPPGPRGAGGHCLGTGKPAQSSRADPGRHQSGPSGLEPAGQAGNLCPQAGAARPKPSRIRRAAPLRPGRLSLKHSLLYKRDFYAGGLMMLFGLFAALNGPRYTLGTLMHMGPGVMPTTLGVILTILGIGIAATALTEKEGEGEEGILPEHPQWFAWGCILASPLAFILFGKYGGMIPGTFMCVFVAALGDRDQTWRGAVILSAVVTSFGV